MLKNYFCTVNLFKSFFFIVVFSALVAWGQLSATLEVSNHEIGIGESLVISIKVVSSKKVSGLSWPSIQSSLSGFKVSKNHNTSRSSYTNIINSKISSKTEYIHNFDFTLVPRSKGLFSIGPIIFKHQNYNKNFGSININVIKKEQGIDVQTLLSKRNIYVGEPVFCEIKFIIRNQVQNVNVNLPKIKSILGDKFRIEQISFDNKAHFEVINGIRRQVANAKFMLWPLLTGDVVLPAIPIEYTEVMQRSGSRFFRNQLVKKIAYSNLQKMKVIRPPLPIPNDYSGLNGESYTIYSSLNTKQTKTGEIVNYQVMLEGDGNFKGVSLPKLVIDGFEVFKPEIKTTENPQGNSWRTKQVLDYVLIPNKIGELSIPVFTLNYFNTKTKKYQSIQSSAHKIIVTQGKAPLSNNLFNSGSTIDQQDINYLKLNTKVLKKESGALQGVAYWLILLFFLVLYVLLRIDFTRRQFLKKNVSKLRNKKAKQEAEKRLVTAKLHLGKQEDKLFYKELLQSLERFLSDKLNIEIRGITLKKSIEVLESKKVPTHLIQRFKEIITKCEMAQYAQVKQVHLQEDYQVTIALINQLHEKL